MAWIDPVKNKNGQGWRVGHRRDGKKVYSEIYKTHDEAKQCRAKFELESTPIGKSLFTPLQVLWDKYLEQCVHEGRLPSTIANKKYESKHFLSRFKVLGDLTKDNIREFRAELTKTVSTIGPNKGNFYTENSVKDKLRVLHSFVSWLVDNEYLTQDPMRLIKVGAPVRTGRAYPKSIMLQFIEASKEIKNFHRVFMVLISTGARMGEVFDRLSWDKISKDGIVVLEKTKNKQDRTIFIRPEILALFGPRGEGRLCQGYTRYQFYMDWKKVRDKVGLSGKVVPHHFRHTYATHYIKRFKDPSALMRVMGWKDIKTANTYVHLMQDWVTKTQKEFELVDD